MATQEDLTVAYHQQDTDYYCGAACAQMILDSIGAGLLDQDDLYTDNHNHSTIESAWYTAPDGLQWTLNDRRPAGFGGWFVTYSPSTEDTISRKLVWTIHHYQVAPAALVFGWDHWIVIRGFDASAAPSSSSDTGYTITAFDVNNPWPPCPSWYAPSAPPPPPPPPHSGGDGCGTGGNHGIDNQHIAYATWKSTYMTGVPSGHWKGDFVAVCDPDPPAQRLGDQAPRPERLSGERLLDGGEAIELAIRGLEQYGLRRREDWGRILEGTEPSQPHLVQRLDVTDTFYYLVPMVSNDRASAFVSVDGRFGDYRETGALSRAQTVFEMLDPRRAVEMIAGRVFDLDEPLGRVRVRPDAYCLYPTLVWKPCRESLSPFYPFHMVTIGGHRLYIRVDGAVFTQLHPAGRGI
ncbi:MAG: hypothetical protein WBV06_11425 [Acidimicrobiia bacterium]